jgi:hypothetical protein
VDAFSCLNDGKGREDGTCDCVGVLEGDMGWCEISGKGNSNCHAHFNSEQGAFDGGDCCNMTCCNGDKYLCSFDEMGNYVEFPHCIDPKKLDNRICDLSLNMEEHIWLWWRWLLWKNMWQLLELWHNFAVNIQWAMRWLPFLPWPKCDLPRLSPLLGMGKYHHWSGHQFTAWKHWSWIHM